MGTLFLFLKFQIAHRLRRLRSSGSKKRETKWVCLSEAKTSHSHKTWSEVCCSAALLLPQGMSISPIIFRCLLTALCPERRPLRTLDCVLLKDSSLVLAVGLRSEINFRGCLCVLIRSNQTISS